MKKRIASLFLTLLVCMSLTVPAMAGGSLLTDPYFSYSNGKTYTEFLDSSKSGKGWSFDLSSYTLTLDGFTAQDLRIYNTKQPLTLKLADGSVNTITVDCLDAQTEGGLIITGGGTLNIESIPDVVVSMNLLGKTTVKSGTITAAHGIFLNNGSLVIEGGTVTAGGLSRVTNEARLSCTVTGGTLILDSDGKAVNMIGGNVATGLESATAVGKNGEALSIRAVGDFAVLCDASGTPASYAKITAKGTAPVQPVKPAAPSFTDVAATAYYSAPVQWAVGKGITTGTTATTFSPNNTCTRAQIITFLYRAAGSPEPKGSGAFTDVDASAYYAKAAQWAAEQGMASGSTFSPNAPCTRMMAVEFMWKQAGSPDADAAAFTDASSPAVDWAVSAGVTTGVTASTFAPDNTCTRAQIVTFLYRAFAD